MWTWVSKKADSIVALSTVVGLFVSVAGFGLTFWQLRQTTLQLQYSNEYSIRKDLRELIQEIAPKLRLECLAVPTDCDERQTMDTMQSLGLLFNFHQSVYRQSKASGISPAFKAQMADDFCQSFDRSEVSRFWETQVSAGHYKDERIAMRSEWCQVRVSK